MSDELAIARKARDAATEAADLRAENAKLVEMLDALRATTSGLALKPEAVGERKCYRCTAIYVNKKRRTVECQQCGAKLDPFDVLFQYATKERTLLQWNASFQAEHAKLKAEIEALKGDAAKARTERVECPRGCRKFVAVSMSHPGNVAPHACYEKRARLGLVPRDTETRWRAVSPEGATKWVDRMTAMRTAANADGARVEEFTGPIGEAAERALGRVEHERQWRERMARRGP